MKALFTVLSWVEVGKSYIKYSPGFLGRLGTWGRIPGCGHDHEFNFTLATSTWEKRSPLDLTPPLVSMAREAFELVYGYWRSGRSCIS
jgi:hypothetical protein